LDGVLVGEKVDDLEGVGNDPDGHLLLSVVSSLEFFFGIRHDAVINHDR
jgi:hypothetical protein